MTSTMSKTTYVDLYPTRKGDETMVSPRDEPIVHGTAEQGPMDAAQLDLYAVNGSVSSDYFITQEELDLYRAELPRLSADPPLQADEPTVFKARSDQGPSTYDLH